jgi:DNA-binding NarL/FixJ family response regulator
MLQDPLAAHKGSSLWAGHGLPSSFATAGTWQIVVCSGNALFCTAVCLLQPRVQLQCSTVEALLHHLANQPVRSLVLIASEDWLDCGLLELLPSLRAQMRPAQLQVVLFLEDQQDPVRLQGLIGAGVQVICRLELFQAKLLAGAINAALRNRPWLDPLFAGLIQPAQGSRQRALGAPHHLPRRERELLRQVGQGYNALEISHRLGIRTDTVRRTLSRAYRRIGVRDRAQAVGWCLCHGLISRRELERRYRPQVEQVAPIKQS